LVPGSFSFFGVFSIGANLGFPLGFGGFFESVSLLVAIVLSFGGIALIRLGTRIATKNGEYESYWLG
jgi:hypothetical protein